MKALKALFSLYGRTDYTPNENINVSQKLFPNPSFLCEENLGQLKQLISSWIKNYKNPPQDEGYIKQGINILQNLFSSSSATKYSPINDVTPNLFSI